MEKEEEEPRVDLENDLKECKRKSNVSLPDLGLSHETLLSDYIDEITELQKIIEVSGGH